MTAVILSLQIYFRFLCNFGTFVFEDPKPDEITAAQTAWLINYLNGFKTVLDSPNYADPSLGYHQYINAGSFLDHFWLQEMMRNPDAYVVSALCSRIGWKLHMGPLWDFQCCLRTREFYERSVSTGMGLSPAQSAEPVAKIFDRLRPGS